MKKSTFLYCWNANSESAKLLKDALGIQRIKAEHSKFIYKPNRLVINWGSSSCPDQVLKCELLNHPNKVGLVTNKLKFFEAVKDHKLTPDWTTDKNKALEWIGDGFTVVARTVLNGHSGEGIVIMNKNNPQQFVKAPLYVKYIPKTEEYRIHVVKGKVIDSQQKTLSKDYAQKAAEQNLEINWKIRNLHNGFIYQRSNINPSPAVLDAAVKTLQVIGLDFGAVDIVVSKKNDNPYVLEVNSAPGIQGTTLENYIKAFKELV